MEEASDEVADDMVLSAGVPAASYARHLADWAERYLPSRREAAAALGVIRFRSALAARVRRILDAACRRITRLSRPALVGIGLAAAVVCLAASVFALGSRPRSLQALLRGPLRVEEEEERDESPRSPFPWMGWCERRWPSPAFERESGRVYRVEGSGRRLEGIEIWNERDIPALCGEVEDGATGLTVWCEGDLLKKLPLLPRGLEITLVCNAEGLSDLAPLREQRGIRELILYGWRGEPDLAPLRSLTELECVRIVRRASR
jgi:hypothetical protein